MLSLEQIKQKLADRKLSVIAQQTGVSRVTLYRLMQPGVTSANSKTLETLSKYFEGAA